VQRGKAQLGKGNSGLAWPQIQGFSGGASRQLRSTAIAMLGPQASSVVKNGAPSVSSMTRSPGAFPGKHRAGLIGDAAIALCP